MAMSHCLFEYTSEHSRTNVAVAMDAKKASPITSSSFNMTAGCHRGRAKILFVINIYIVYTIYYVSI